MRWTARLVLVCALAPIAVPASAAPGCYERSAAQVDAGVIDDDYDYFAARHFANPDCGDFDPDRAAVLYRRALTYTGGPNIAAGYYALLRDHPDIAARPDSPSSETLWRIAARGVSGWDGNTHDLLKTWFGPSDGPRAIAFLKDLESSPAHESFGALLEALEEQPILIGRTFNECRTGAASSDRPIPTFRCSEVMAEIAQRTPYREDREFAKRHQLQLLYFAAYRNNPDALIAGAKMFLKSDHEGGVRDAYKWLIRIDDGPEDLVQLREEVAGRLSLTDRTLIHLLVRKDDAPPLLPGQ